MAIYVYAIATVSLKGPLPGTSEETSLSAQLADSPPSVTAQTQEIDGERKTLRGVPEINADRSPKS
jgi:hypothetical protein